jgi:hypothetical protein
MWLPPQSGIGVGMPLIDRKSQAIFFSLSSKQVQCRNPSAPGTSVTMLAALSQKITYAHQRAYWSFSGFAGARGGLLGLPTPL